MLEVSPEQQQKDQAVVAEYVYKKQTMDVEAWEPHFHTAVERVGELYEEFVPDLPERFRLFGSLLGGSGMAFLELQYGKDAADVRLYGGSYETDVLAVYHNAMHSWNFMRNMFHYATLINDRDGPDADGYLPYDEEYFMRAPHIASCHDGIIGNGRGHDERQSALFAGYLMMHVGGSLTPDEPSMAGVEATTWNDEKQQQLSYEGEDFPRYRRAAKVSDLLTTHKRLGLFDSICVIQEDLTKVRHGRVLTLEAQRRGFDLQTTTMEERMEFIDDSDVVRSAWRRLLGGQVGFLSSLQLADPTIASEFPEMPDNIELMTDLYGRYTGRCGGLTAVGVLREVKAYAGVA